MCAIINIIMNTIINDIVYVILSKFLSHSNRILTNVLEQFNIPQGLNINIIIIIFFYVCI